MLKISEKLKEAGINPKKSLGQNFLVNEKVYKQIIAALEARPSDTVIEVGPGLGTLTDYLIQTGAKIIAVEKDDKLAEYLKKKYAGNLRVEIIHDDILKFNLTNYQIPITNYKLVGNIPFYLTSHLIKMIFETWPVPEKIVFMVQKEVAKRIVGLPPHSSLLSVGVQYYSTPEIIDYVSKGNFYPTPKVDSAIIRLKPGNEKPAPEETKNFFRVVTAGFSANRKQLANNLSAILKLPRPVVDEKLLLAVIAPSRRAETLTLDEWQKIAKIFS